MPTVSVIIPAFNAEKFLRETLESALGQTVPPLEVIVVDDGSTDGTVALVERFRGAVRLLRQANGGVARARNAGAAQAKGEWLAFLDADDVWLPGKLERQMASADAALIHTDRYNIGVLDGLPAVHGDLQPLVDGDVFSALLIGGNVITTSSVALRTEVFRDLGGFDEDPRLLAEDWDLWLRVAERHAIRACREPLVRYRLHAAGLSRNPAKMNRARLLIVGRALALPRGAALPAMERRRIWSETHRTNGWDAARHGRRLSALASYAKGAAWWPLNMNCYMGAARTLAGSY